MRLQHLGIQYIASNFRRRLSECCKVDSCREDIEVPDVTGEVP